jgi:hypothetical protein
LTVRAKVTTLGRTGKMGEVSRGLLRSGASAWSVLLAVLAFGACNLRIENPNDPETKRALSRPQDVEALLASQYLRWHLAVYGTGGGNLWTFLNAASLELVTSVQTGGSPPLGIPRAAFANDAAFQVGKGSYFALEGVARVTATILTRLDEPDFYLGLPGTTAQNLRARAFAQFVRGISLGYLALIYDSASVVNPGQGTEDPGVLAGYREVMDSALSALQQALEAATAPATGSGGFPLPASWLPGPTEMSTANFVRLLRSYRARIRANVARTPAERADIGGGGLVDWAAVIADAQSGITADHYLTTNVTNGPGNGNVRGWMSGPSSPFVQQMAPLIIGMADNSGAYASYLAIPLEQRVGPPFHLVTTDLRFPQGSTRAAQQGDQTVPCSPVPCKRYFVNRTAGDDFNAPSWSWTEYSFIRWHPWHNNGASALQPGGSGLGGGNGYFPFFTLAELDLLQAEGHIRKQTFAAAAPLINKTRSAAGLPAITGFDNTAPVPGGSDCVPKVPLSAVQSGGSTTTLTCGNLMEAMKYEKRIETLYTHLAGWWLDSRGWGDLPEGTGTCWAPPYDELRARSLPVYSTGGFGLGNVCTAGKGTYGW